MRRSRNCVGQHTSLDADSKFRRGDYPVADVIVHQYLGIDIEFVWGVIADDLPDYGKWHSASHTSHCG